MKLTIFGVLLLIIIQIIPILSNRSVVTINNSFKDIPPFYQILKGIALTILVLWTIAANTLVFVVLYKNPNLQTTPNLLVFFYYFLLTDYFFSFIH